MAHRATHSPLIFLARYRLEKLSRDVKFYVRGLTYLSGQYGVTSWPQAYAFPNLGVFGYKTDLSEEQPRATEDSLDQENDV